MTMLTSTKRIGSNVAQERAAFPQILATAIVALTVLEAAIPACAQARPAGKTLRPVLEVSGWVVDNTYRTDSDGHFQYGTPAVQSALAGSIGLTTKMTPSASFELDGVNENIRTEGLPQPVVEAAKQFSNPPLDLNKTSLRLQVAWGVGVGIPVFRHFEFGGRYSVDDWRYDWLGNPSGTTIPYLRGVMSSSVGFVRYSKEFRRFQAVLDAGGGLAPARFTQGYESYLSNGHEFTLAKLSSGTTVPLSGRLGYTVFKSDDEDQDASSRLVAFGRYDYSFSNLGATRIYKRQIVFGVEYRLGRQ